MEYAFYQVLHPFVPAPNDKNALAVQKDDVLLISVQSPFLESSPHRKGWLYAYNRCAGTEGYVPVETVKLLGSEKNNTIHHPSAPGVEVADVMPETDKFKTKTSHQLIDLHVLNPVLCVHCNDYIWGLTKVLSRCKGLNCLKGNLYSCRAETSFYVYFNCWIKTTFGRPHKAVMNYIFVLLKMFCLNLKILHTNYYQHILAINK